MSAREGAGTGFSITSPTNTVALSPQGEGNATFAVANQTGHAVQARANAVPLGPTDPSWLRLIEPVERRFTVGATEAFVVAISVPRDAPGGRYPFRLDVLSIPLPDEEWGHGPVVVFEVSKLPIPQPPVEEEPPGYVETVIGAAAVALVLSIIVTFVSGYYSIPSLIVTCLGAVIGAFGLLWQRGFRDPWRTALPMLGVLVIISYPIAVFSYDILGSAQPVVTPILIAAPAALAGRAIARWWMFGHL